MKKLIFGILFSLIFAASVVYGLHYYLDNLRTVEEKPLYKTEKPKWVSLSTRKGAYMTLKNVNFRFTPEIQLNINTLDAELVPISPASIVNFDDLNSFQIRVFAGEASLHADVMKYIFTQHIFNYENAPLKIETLEMIEPEPGKEENLVKLTGEMKFVIWLKFEMIGKMVLDKENMKIIIVAEKMTALYNPYTKQLLEAIALDLEKLVQPLPEGRGIAVRKNMIIVSPYSLFPAPALTGNISSLKVKNNSILLTFEDNFKLNPPPLPRQGVSNYLFLFNGDVKFGQLFMNMRGNASMEMIDNDPKDPFDFYLKEYFQILTGAGTRVLMQPNKSVVVEMSDYSDAMGKK